MAGLYLNHVKVAEESGGIVSLPNTVQFNNLKIGGTEVINSNRQIQNITGIDFSPSSGTGTPSSNLLDDYEEGTFLPVYKATVTDPTTTGYYTLREGFYIKIGKLVHINLRIRGEISSVGSGNAILGGLPFTVDSTAGSTSSLSIGYFENWTTNGPTLAMADENTTTIALFRDNGASGTRITVSNYKTGNASYNEVFLAGTYLTN